MTRVRRRYQPGDLDDAWYAVAAADEPAVNAAIAQEGERARAFCSGPAVNPVVAPELLTARRWLGSGVLGPEAFAAVPFLDLLSAYGAPWGLREGG